MTERSSRVEEVISEVQRIREAVDDIANIQDKALLASFGITQSSNEGSSDDDTEPEKELSHKSFEVTPELIEHSKQILALSEYNWFELQQSLECKVGCDFGPVLDRVYCKLPTFGFTQCQVDLVIQSRSAYIAAQNDASESQRIAQVVNGCIVTESESDNPHLYATLDDPLSETGRLIIAARRKAIQSRRRRLRAKAVAEQSFLSRKSSKRVSKVLTECKDVGNVIEQFVSQHNVGADAWRRTGVLTFDGNTKLPQKVTYERIRLNLQDVYKRHFAYGTVVQLCVARNNRRLSSKRYQGVAKVTTRRARKGFALRYNPDSHWSAALYKGLNSIQLQDGEDICNINHDDAAGFRLDTLTTSKQYATPTVRGQDILTTRTDYVNKYPSALQTTSYHFSRTETTGEICVGVVKAPSGIHPKNPCQHSEDLQMLEQQDELMPAFYNLKTGLPKSVDAVRVDGASDEGPSHDEVQYYWTQRHLLKNKLATLVTTRSSGSSFLNRVELQNGCLSLGHSNTFIPSTLAGSCVDTDTGAINKQKLKDNMNLAIDAYISRVDRCPCGDTEICLYRGPDSSERQEVRDELLIFLKGSNKAKKALRLEEPSLYTEFQLIWNVRANHMVPDLPSYIFFLICCYDKNCPHPRCQDGPPQSPTTWYPGGPSLLTLPLPVLDLERAWGNPSCSSCMGFCSGHYMTKSVDVSDKKALTAVPKPPAATLKELFSASTITSGEIQNAAKKVLLPPQECEIWLKHLQTILDNRRRGAKKAAETRRAKRNVTTTASHVEKNIESETINSGETEEECFCGDCGQAYEEETAEPEIWIECTLCNRWFHCTCEKLTSPPSAEATYICLKCRM